VEQLRQLAIMHREEGGAGIGSAEPRRNVEPEPLAAVEKIITELTLEQAYRVTKSVFAATLS